jgi:ethanolamine utilization protein EutQ (cupin superfamily)
MIPTVGDALGKGTKLAIWLNKTAPKTVAALGEAKKHYPKIKKAIIAAKALFKEYKPEVDDLIEKVMNGEKLKNWTEKDPEIKDKLKRVKLKLDDVEEIFEKSDSILDSLNLEED